MFKNRRRIRNAFTIILIFLIVILLYIIGFVIYSELTNKVPSYKGYSVMNIISTSMQPQIPQNTLILIKKTDPHEIEVGDIITFYSQDPTIKGIPNTHRVAGIAYEEGALVFTTKGDANAIIDKYTVMAVDVIGVYEKNLITVGKIGMLMQNRLVVFLVLVVPATVLFIWEIFNVAKISKEAEVIEGVTQEDIDKYLKEQEELEKKKKEQELDGTND